MMLTILRTMIDMYYNRMSYVKITHMKTGLSCEINQTNIRSQHKARAKAIELLKARIHSIDDRNKFIENKYNNIISYTLHDTMYPEELSDYRKEKLK